MLQLLNAISVISSFLFGTGLIYCLLDITIGRIKLLHSTCEWNGLQIKDIFFIIIAVFSILQYTSFIEPYR